MQQCGEKDCVIVQHGRIGDDGVWDLRMAIVEAAISSVMNRRNIVQVKRLAVCSVQGIKYVLDAATWGEAMCTCSM
jgi:hypothetical protein